jgi:hypothetical protein
MANSDRTETTGLGSTGGGETSEGVVETAKQKASEIAHAASESVSKAASVASEKVTEQASAHFAAGKERAAEGVSSVADALKQTGDKLREQQQTVIPEYLEGAADQILRIADYVGSADAQEIVRDVERFARRRPMLYLGAAFGLGIFLARFLRASRSGDATPSASVGSGPAAPKLRSVAGAKGAKA